MPLIKRSLSTVNRVVKIDWQKWSPKQRQLLERMLRVNQAGELGAVRIYEGQLFVLGKTSEAPVLKVR